MRGLERGDILFAPDTEVGQKPPHNARVALVSGWLCLDTAGFEHRAVWNERRSRVEMHLVSRHHQSVQIAGERVDFARGEHLRAIKANGLKVDSTDGDFVIGPEYRPAAELDVAPGVPRGRVQQFTMDSKDSRFYQGIAREVFGTVDPKNPKTLIVETHPIDYKRTVTVYVPAQYLTGTAAPFIVTHGTLRAENKLSTSVADASFCSHPASISTASAGRTSPDASCTSAPGSVPPTTA